MKALRSVAFARWNDDGIIHCDRECWKVIWLLKFDRESKIEQTGEGKQTLLLVSIFDMLILL